MLQFHDVYKAFSLSICMDVSTWCYYRACMPNVLYFLAYCILRVIFSVMLGWSRNLNSKIKQYYSQVSKEITKSQNHDSQNVMCILLNVYSQDFTFSWLYVHYHLQRFSWKNLVNNFNFCIRFKTFYFLLWLGKSGFFFNGFPEMLLQISNDPQYYNFEFNASHYSSSFSVTTVVL